MARSWRCVLVLALAACEPIERETEPNLLDIDTARRGLIDCSERQDTGYARGNPFSITVITVDGKPVERNTGNAYHLMQRAAEAAGVRISIVSGFRTMAEQQRLYSCYVNCNCNNCNLAARPGYSNHQSGHALDLNTSSSGVLAWLNANAGRFGFARTVSSEPWHWEWWSGGPGGGPCGHCRPSCSGSRITQADCSVGDCGAFGATCVDDALGARCASVFCPARGRSEVCLDAQTIGHCDDGAISTGNCGAFGATCVDDALGARCASVFCPPRGAATLCLDDTTLATCSDGAISGGDCAAFGATCVDDDIGARCASVFCPARGDTTLCLDDHTLATCSDGAITRGDCANFFAYCSSEAGPARCVSALCVDGPDRTPVAREGCGLARDRFRCDAAGDIEIEPCPVGQRCSVYPALGCVDAAAVPCPDSGEASVCLGTDVLARCAAGSLVAAEPCRFGCDTANGGAACLDASPWPPLESNEDPPRTVADGVAVPRKASFERKRVSGGCSAVDADASALVIALPLIAWWRRRRSRLSPPSQRARWPSRRRPSDR